MGRRLAADILCFDDNTASQHALIKGFSANRAANALVGLFWLGAAHLQRNPWFERVTSGDNLSDPISREDIAMARDRGWHPVQIDLAALWPVLLRVLNPPFGFSRAVAVEVIEACRPVEVRRWVGPDGDG